MSHDGSALASIADVSGDVTAGNRDARLSDTLVSADVVGISVRVYDVVDRLFGNLADRGENFIAQRCGARIHNEYAFIANLQRDIDPRGLSHLDTDAGLDKLTKALVLDCDAVVASWNRWDRIVSGVGGFGFDLNAGAEVCGRHDDIWNHGTCLIGYAARDRSTVTLGNPAGD